jgi:c-di-GMP-binding flagellar brake protein YcgR
MERRRNERVPYNKSVDVNAEAGKPIEAESVDLSESGFRFRSESKLPEDASVSLSFTIEEEEDAVEVPLSAQAKVARCDPDEDGKRYDVGIEFFDLSEESKKRLNDVVKKMKKE